MADRKFDGYTTSYSGTDMVVSVVVPNGAPIVWGTATTISYSVFRQLANVRTLGRITPRGFARGGRTYAGSIIFTVIRESFVEELRAAVKYLGDFKKLLSDELPPLDIILTMGNEFGQHSSMNIYGMRFVDESQTMSIEDIFTENILTFICEDLQPMRKNDKDSLYIGTQTFNAYDETLGKFKVSELIANMQAAERQKLLDEIAKLEAERWKEPVMSDPGNVPNFDPVGGGGSGGGTNPNPNITSGSNEVFVIVYDGSKNDKTLQGADVWATIDGAKVSKTSDKDGRARFYGLTPGASLVFNASKTGYTSDKKSKKVGPKGTTETVTINLAKKPASGKEPPENETFVTRRYGKYAHGDFVQSDLFDKKNDKDRPQIQVQNSKSKGIKGIEVEWTWKIYNWDEMKKKWLGNFGSAFFRETGTFGKTKTNADGIATFPWMDLGGFPGGSILIFYAKPAKTPGGKVADKSLWQEFSFALNLSIWESL